MFPISDTAPYKKDFPFITLILIVVTSYVFYLQISNSDAFTIQYALIPSLINFSQPSTLYPVITSIFLHGGWLHIISNLWFLWVFGDNVESAVGHIRYVCLYLIAGIAGSLAQYALAPSSSIPLLGASGAIAGVLGAYFILFPHNKVKTFIPIFGFFTLVNVSASFMLGYWFVLQLISGAASIPGMDSVQGGVAFWAHVGGFVIGLIVGKFLGHVDKGYIEGEIL